MGDIAEQIEEEWNKMLHMKIKTFKDAIRFLDWAKSNGFDVFWSIQYYGFGEHFTFWTGFGGFHDFGIDQNTPITWRRMKEIIIQSARDLQRDICEWEEKKERGDESGS